MLQEHFPWCAAWEAQLRELFAIYVEASPFSGLWFYWIGFLGALLSVIVLIGIVLAPMALCNALKFTQGDFAEMISANNALGQIATLTAEGEVEAAIAAFNQSRPKRLSELMFG